MVEQSPDGPAPAQEPIPVEVVAADGDDEDLAESVRSLAGLSAARFSLEDLLTRVAYVRGAQGT